MNPPFVLATLILRIYAMDLLTEVHRDLKVQGYVVIALFIIKRKKTTQLSVVEYITLCHEYSILQPKTCKETC